MLADVWVEGVPVSMSCSFDIQQCVEPLAAVLNVHGTLTASTNVAHVAFLPCWRLRNNMKMLESALWILAALAMPWIAAQDSRTAELCKINSNGCSVPVSSVPCQQHFLAACDRHDTCYLCGAHFSLTQKDCDDAFLAHMIALCADGTDDEGFCLEKRKRREASSMSITTPLRQLQLLEKLMPLNSLWDHDSRQPQQRFIYDNCTDWASTYYNTVQTFGSFYFYNTANATLAEVGVLEPPREQGKAYETGQLFLHKIFGYRGIVLFPWLARVYDRDIATKTEERTLDDQTTTVGKEVKGRSHLYYQVLIDARDCPHIRAQTEAVTFLGNQENSRALYAIPGLDYVAHEDLLPYSTVEQAPIQHELFDKFLMHDSESSPPFMARETLRAWQEKNHPWLQLSDVHRETTENIRVTVIPFYMGCREAQQTNVFWWRYCVRLENMGEETVQLRERHWRIFSLSGTLETVRGRGVVGQEPILNAEQPAFQYSSHVSLQAPSGHMWGTYKMERRDGTSFDCKIPPFSLESKSDDSSSPHGFLGS